MAILSITPHSVPLRALLVLSYFSILFRPFPCLYVLSRLWTLHDIIYLLFVSLVIPFCTSFSYHFLFFYNTLLFFPTVLKAPRLSSLIPLSLVIPFYRLIFYHFLISFLSSLSLSVLLYCFFLVIFLLLIGSKRIFNTKLSHSLIFLIIFLIYSFRHYHNFLQHSFFPCLTFLTVTINLSTFITSLSPGHTTLTWPPVHLSHLCTWNLPYLYVLVPHLPFFAHLVTVMNL